MINSKLKVLFVYSDRFCHCTSKRCFEIVNGLWRFHPKEIKAHAIYYQNLEESHFQNYSVIVFQRLGANAGFISDAYKTKIENWMFKYQSGTKYLYDIDDLLLNNQNNTPIWFLEKCHQALAPNEFLAKELEKYKKCQIIRTHVDLDSIFQAPPMTMEAGIHIGWFSIGANGIKAVKECLNKLPKQVFIHLFCDSYFHNYAKDQITNPNFILHAIVPPSEMYRFMKSMRCIINPLGFHELTDATIQSSEFFQSKSEIKYALAGACQVPLVVSPIGIYQSIITHGVNGFFARTSDEWDDCLCQLIQNPHLSKAVGLKAYEDVQVNYSLRRAVKDYFDLFTSIA